MTEFNNYRPISLLPQFSKMLEKLLDLRMQKFINKITAYMIVNFDLDLVNSPSMALISLIETITTSLDVHKQAIVYFFI